MNEHVTHYIKGREVCTLQEREDNNQVLYLD